MKYGLYDENDNLIKTWKELTDLGLNIEKDFVDTNTYFSVDPSSGYSVFKENNVISSLVIFSFFLVKIIVKSLSNDLILETIPLFSLLK